MTGRKPRPLHREPLVVALVLTNVGLGALLLYRSQRTSRPAGLPPGHPDVSVPEGMMIPPAGAPGRDGMGGGDDGVPMAPEFQAVERAARGGAAAGEELALTGTVTLLPSLKDPWPKGAPVFVIARAQGGGPPFAVRRYDGARPPFAYSLGPANVMLEGTPAPRRLLVSVRVDQDGDALTRQLGDLEGGPSKPVGPKGTVDVTVDRPATLVR